MYDDGGAQMVMFALGGLLVMILGIYVTKRAFTVRSRANLVQETPTEDVGSVSMGQSEIKGAAIPTEEGTITAPFSDEECLVAVWEVKEVSDSSNSSKKWRRLGNGVDYVPFLVDDGTGQALVRPSEQNLYDLNELQEADVEVRDGESPPPRIEAFLDRDDWRGHGLTDEVWRLGGESVSGYEDGDRVFRQHLVTPGETVYVFGVVQERAGVRSADNAANVVIEKVPEGDEDLEDMFLISDKDEAELMDQGSDPIKWYAFGTGLAMFGAIMFFGDLFLF